MEIIVGEKSSFALSMSLLSNESVDGFIWIYVNGRRYGSESVECDIKFFLERMIWIANDLNQYLPEIFHFNSRQFAEYIDCTYDDFETKQCQVYADQAKLAERVDKDIVFRSGCYGFDHLLIGVVDNEFLEKIFVCNRELDQHDDVIVDRGTFRLYLVDLLRLCTVVKKHTRITGS